MKIFIVNTYDRGGAANSCKRLHLGLLSIGIKSNVLLRFKQNNWIKSFSFVQPAKTRSFFEKISNKLKRIRKELKLYSNKDISKDKELLFLKNRNKGFEMFSFPNSHFDIMQSEFYKESDIVNLHWVANFLDYQNFFKINNKPVVWTLHDMNPFSGGEHYEEKYLGIDEFGFPIKRQISEEEKRIAKENIEIKKQAISKVNNLTIVAPCQWLAEEARKSEVFINNKVICIPYGLDSEVFSPRDKKFSRELLNIPKDKRVILFVADSINNNRKGFVFLKKAFEKLANPDLVLCAIGNKNSALASIDNIYELGPIYDERLMSIAYSAADVFVIPSLMDNLPNTVLESLMCGTPVIGFSVGGIVDMIQHKKNGLLVKEISVQSLLETLQEFLEFENVFDSSEIRKNAVEKYDLKVQAYEYEKLFNSILHS
ncbi:glycosyltransferase [Flavobacterium sp. LC2016-12]|uniref:glycosyltransferase n=1 Tax=Flavobacterium sp. LC2016-12 TaxID=2783794 RepID=UPI00188D3640|nr:glycosyltransferase [Flavobacterium sp. LC2016-12]MBF4465657.1 glycosyltransferase [Flavobacterium sp. LC2016-12]